MPLNLSKIYTTNGAKQPQLSDLTVKMHNINWLIEKSVCNVRFLYCRL